MVYISLALESLGVIGLSVVDCFVVRSRHTDTMIIITPAMPTATLSILTRLVVTQLAVDTY